MTNKQSIFKDQFNFCDYSDSNSYKQREGTVILKTARLCSSREVGVSTDTEDQGFTVSSSLFLGNCDSFKIQFCHHHPLGEHWLALLG